MPNICPGFALNMPIICLRLTPDIPKICPRYAQYNLNIPKICHVFAQDMKKRIDQEVPKKCLKRAQAMPNQTFKSHKLFIQMISDEEKNKNQFRPGIRPFP